ncbi:MAG: RNA polymerase sigma factor [Candidatus Aminicenantes bacterium]|nr:RNA polymerase sigma factor [Candidatus Aminicenantes bacterium]
MNDLIAKLKDGNESAFKEVMAMYKKPIYNFLSLLLGDRQLAEELTQDTFVKVYFKARTLKSDHPQAVKSWIYSIATNLARSEFRKRRFKHMFSLSDLNERHACHCPDLESRLLAEQLLALVPEKWRVPLVMKEMDNFTFEEIARMLNKPIGTVKSMVFRGKEHLRKQCLTPEGAAHV